MEQDMAVHASYMTEHGGTCKVWDRTWWYMQATFKAGGLHEVLADAVVICASPILLGYYYKRTRL